MKLAKSQVFACGILAAAMIVMFVQNYMGQEAYSLYMNEHWISLSPWLSAAGLVVVLLMVFLPPRTKKNSTSSVSIEDTEMGEYDMRCIIQVIIATMRLEKLPLTEDGVKQQFLSSLGSGIIWDNDELVQIIPDEIRRFK